jgi:hypothetical protein
VTGLKERSAPDLLGGLVADGIIASDTLKGPVSLRFPLDAVDMLLPALFSERMLCQDSTGSLAARSA